MEKLRLWIEEQVVFWTHMIPSAHRSFENINFVKVSKIGVGYGEQRFLEEGAVPRGVPPDR